MAILVLTLGPIFCRSLISEAAPIGTAFTYQGRLIDENKPADGLYDIAFVLFDAPEGPNEIYATGVEDLDVVDGYFTVELDFGSRVFDGNRRWLEAAVRPYDSNDPNAYVTLSPRTELTPAPYALYATSGGADSDWTISGNDMHSAVSGNVGIGTSYPSEKLAVNGDINISIDSAYKINGDTVLSTSDKSSIFVGIGAGEQNTIGFGNTFLGTAAGYLNTTGYYNTFVGCGAGYLNTTGYNNTFLGFDAGESNTEGYSNTFIGYCAGHFNTDGIGNVFLGHEAGFHERGSNKLYIANGRDDPNVLIYGDFSTGRVGIGTMSLGTAKLSVMGGNVGIGTTSPTSKLEVSGGIINDFAIYRNELPSGTDGGVFTPGSWTTRTLNTTLDEYGTSISRSGSQITLAAGTYYVEARAPAFHVNRHKAVLYNVTDAQNALIGSSAYSDYESDDAQTDSVIRGTITISGTKTFEVRHRSQGSGTYGNEGGLASNFGVVEVYTEIYIRKLR